MRLSPLSLNPRLSTVSRHFIEFFSLAAVFLLPFSKSAAEIGVWTALVLWVLRKFPWNEKFPRVPHCGAAAAVFFAFVLLSIIGVPHEMRASALRGAGKWLKYLGIFFMAADLFSDRRRAGRFAGAFLISMALVCADGLFQMAAGRDLIKGYSVDIPGRFVRMQGPFSSPNDLAAFFLVALPLAFFYWMREEKWTVKSAGFAVLLALFGVCFISTLSRSAFLGLVAAAAFYALWGRRKKILLLTALVPAVLWISPMLRYNFFGSLALKDITVGERLEMWRVTLRMIQAHPWLGNGINTYTESFSSFASAASTFRGYAHNCYLQMAAEIGLPGLIAFLAPFAFILPAEIKRDHAHGHDPLKTALLIGIPAYLAMSALDTNFYALQAAVMFWFFWGMLNALRSPGLGLRS